MGSMVKTPMPHQVMVRLSDDLKGKLEARADEDERSLAYVIRQACEHFLSFTDMGQLDEPGDIALSGALRYVVSTMTARSLCGLSTEDIRGMLRWVDPVVWLLTGSIERCPERYEVEQVQCVLPAGHSDHHRSFFSNGSPLRWMVSVQGTGTSSLSSGQITTAKITSGVVTASGGVVLQQIGDNGVSWSGEPEPGEGRADPEISD